MPHRYVRAIDPIVQHGIRELREGATVGHTLTEVALMGALVGAGATPTQAVRQVEQMERQLIGMGAWERAEQPMFHQQPMMGSTWGARGMQQPWGAVPPHGVTPWGKQQAPWNWQQSRTMTGDWGH